MAGLYIHIPICASRCFYCDFYSTTIKDKQKALVDGICKEMNLRKEYLQGEPVHTVYFGGGTPTLLPVKETGKMVETLFRLFDCSLEEMTIEANPDDLSPQYLRELRNRPFNRISIGIQSFKDHELKLLNRRHTSGQAIDAVKTCQDAGFNNISIDLIYGLPGQTLPHWEENLQIAIDLQISHISAYHLSYEKGTELFRQLQQGKIAQVEESVSEAMFKILRERLQGNGFRQYEISNFAKTGMESKHNSAYWNGIPYIGLGPSAHSYNRRARQWNVSDLIVYLSALETGESFYETEKLNFNILYNEFIITSLRKMEGMNMELLKEKFGEERYAYCLQHAAGFIATGLLEENGGWLRLSEKGIFVSDGVMAELLWV